MHESKDNHLVHAMNLTLKQLLLVFDNTNTQMKSDFSILWF